MTRASSVLLCAALWAQCAARAQDTPDLAALEQTAQKRHGEWEALAKDMNERMARILPCDPRSSAALAEVSRASDARLAALNEYLRAVTAKAVGETAALRNLLTVEDRSALEASLERNDAAQEQTSVDLQSDALAPSVKQRALLGAPQKLLQQLAAMIRQRADSAEQYAKAADAAAASLRDLLVKFEARDASLREEFAAFEAERGRWNGYYAARRGRAQMECTITQIGASSGTSPAKGAQGKQ